MTEKLHPVQQIANQRIRAIFDIRGLLIHAWKATKDKDTKIFNEAGKPVAGFRAGFSSFLNLYLDPLLEEQGFQPIDIIAVWDGGNEYRRSLYPEYKAHRTEKDPVEQKEFEKLEELAKGFLAAIGVTQVRVAGVEADDVIALLAQQIGKHQPVSIYTVDRDLLVLSEQETVEVFIRGELSEGTEFGGILPRHITLYKALTGDSSDGYGGVPGLGPKKFEALRAEYGDDGLDELDELIRTGNWKELGEIAAETGDKYLLKIVEHKTEVDLCYKLAQLHPELCEGFKGRKKVRMQWYRRVPEERRLQAVLKKHDMEYLFDSYVNYTVVTHLVQNGDNVAELLDGYQTNIVAFDFESYDPEPQESLVEAAGKDNFVNVLHQKVTGASFCYGPNLQYSIYVPIDHSEGNVPAEYLREAIRTTNGRLVVQNAAFEKTVSDLNFGTNFLTNIEGSDRAELVDTAIMASYVDENQQSGLKNLSRAWLNYEQATYEETLAAAGASNMHELIAEQVLSYGCDDSIVTAHLWHLFDLILMVEGTRDFVYEHEFCFVDEMSRTFKEGVPLDMDEFERQKREDGEKLAELEGRLHELAAEMFKTPNVKAVETYLDEIWDAEKAKCREKFDSTKSADGISAWRKAYGYNEDGTERTFDEAFKQYMEEKKAEFFERSYYRLYKRSETVKSSFLPTPVKLNKLLEKLGFEEEYLIQSVAVSRITEWAANVQLNKLDMTEQQERAVQLICETAHAFKERGEDLKPLQDFYDSVIQPEVDVQEEGTSLDVKNGSDMEALLYLMLGLPVRIRSFVDKGSFRDKHGLAGAPSTNDKALETAIAEDTEEDSKEREILQLVRDIRKIRTRFSMYWKPYPLWIYERTGRIHPQIRNCGTVTRRPTGNSPNILQVAKGPVRKIYRPMKQGHIFVDPDFSGQELRILASECKDPTMLDAYLGEVPKDLHSLTASSIAPKIIKRNWPELYKEIQYDNIGGMDIAQFEEWRHSDEEELSYAANWIRNKRAKAVNFLVNYGGTAPTLATNLLVPVAEAEDYIEGLFKRFPGIRKWQNDMVRFARKHGYTQTAYGNRRHVEAGIMSRDDSEARRWERQAINYVIQGCAADILKVVMAEIAKRELNSRYEAYTVAPVYDELLNSVPIEAGLEYMLELKEIMEVTPPGHAVPMVAEFEIGDSWGNLVEITELAQDAYEEALDKLDFMSRKSAA